MRTFERTHPWIKFSVDLRRADSLLWTLLGECQSKCEHIAGVPLRPDTARDLFQVYLAKGIMATTAIEGNPLTEGQVRQHLEGKLQLPPSKEYLAQELDNIIYGCNLILDEIKSAEQPAVSVSRITELNRIVLDKLTLEEEVVPGKIRNHDVSVARYKGAPHEDCGYLLGQLCDWLNSDTFAGQPGLVIVYALIKAILAHLYLVWIHPFGDGNGRTARLVEFQILISSGVPAPSAHLLSNHYNQTREEYYRQLDHASRSGGEVIDFIRYAITGFAEGLRSQVEKIREQQWDVTWRNFVHEAFKNKTSPGGSRQKHLVLDLSVRGVPLKLEELSEVSPRVAAAYARKTKKTLPRDIRELIAMGLLVKEKNKYRAKMEIILAFLPPKVG